jgi:hypothetical protein
MQASLAPSLDYAERGSLPIVVHQCAGARRTQAGRRIHSDARSATIPSVTSASDRDWTSSADRAAARCKTGPLVFGGRSRRRAIALAVSLAIAGAAVYMALHPVVLARATSVSQMTATLNGWQSSLLLSLPGPDRRAGHASAELVRRLDHHAAMGLREIGTVDFATRQAAARRAAPGIIVRSSHQIVGLRVVHRFWDGDLLVEATLLSTVTRATYEPRNGGWRSLETAATVAPVQARLRDTLGVWRIVSVSS